MDENFKSVAEVLWYQPDVEEHVVGCVEKVIRNTSGVEEFKDSVILVIHSPINGIVKNAITSGLDPKYLKFTEIVEIDPSCAELDIEDGSASAVISWRCILSYEQLNPQKKESSLLYKYGRALMRGGRLMGVIPDIVMSNGKRLDMVDLDRILEGYGYSQRLTSRRVYKEQDKERDNFFFIFDNLNYSPLSTD